MNGDDGAFIVISIQQFVPMDILGVEESVLKALQVAVLISVKNMLES